MSFVLCMFCDEPRDGVVDHTECNEAGANLDPYTVGVLTTGFGEDW